MMRCTVILPFLLSVAAFVISFLLLFAGHKEGFMEDYSIIRLNTSTLGYDVLSRATSDGDQDRGGIGGFIDDLSDGVTEFINDLGNDIVDHFSDELGISQWYSIHLMTMCSGDYAPNATDPDAKHNVTSCTKQKPANRVNLTEILDQELAIGPLNLSLADINWPDAIQDQIDTVNKALLAVFILYALAIGFTGLAMLGAVAAFFLDPRRKLASLTNLLLTLLAAIVLLAGSIGIMIGSRKGARELNKVGEVVGLEAEAGGGFIALSWAAFAVMAAAVMYWVAMFCLGRVQKRRGYSEKRGGRY
ncbi:conserved hypothetical protein [Verticillium alfalfae VaMs.102]|uniref:SUR7 protein n=1 Tax=Verticillium alfalfae (strain VaMs.102 / ATCC MYA-4576 / FGSC 10136) TaxID=526221 RepID=C9S827_VERA1|nr:conserved hypothetical protein [Verticillium alfalfae VaMs.102]EEY14873.1 conserved hypothetical protein [Verticillium alfalfae VaMs.102]